MIGQNEERWREVCEQVAVEQDPKKLVELTTEIYRLLEEKRRRLQRKLMDASMPPSTMSGHWGPEIFVPCTPETSPHVLPAVSNPQTRGTIHTVASGGRPQTTCFRVGPPGLEIRRRRGIQIGTVSPT